ncbi:MAG: dTMP kinase, partial [Polaromonas sp.]|nr:dTMP kinase [Polaromonas sp.]
MAPTLRTDVSSLPPEGALRLRPGKAGSAAPAGEEEASPFVASGLFISFEGIDGAGKSTHISALAEAFKAQGRAVTLSREPGGTPLAEKLRAMILNDVMDPL